MCCSHQSRTAQHRTAQGQHCSLKEELGGVGQGLLARGGASADQCPGHWCPKRMLQAMHHTAPPLLHSQQELPNQRSLARLPKHQIRAKYMHSQPHGPGPLPPEGHMHGLQVVPAQSLSVTLKPQPPIHSLQVTQFGPLPQPAVCPFPRPCPIQCLFKCDTWSPHPPRLKMLQWLSLCLSNQTVFGMLCLSSSVITQHPLTLWLRTQLWGHHSSGRPHKAS